MPSDQHPSKGGSSLFVPAGRVTPEEVAEQAGLCLSDPLVQAVLEAVDSYAVVLNEQRQILAANPALLAALSREDPGMERGQRLGEALHCTHAATGPDGCGSSRACQRCGALLAILAAKGDSQQASTGECLLSFERDGRWEAREFTVRSLPLLVAGHQLTLLTLQDISALKRREVLERIFIHDLMNSLQGLQGCTELLQEAGTDPAKVAGQIIDMAGHLTAEVESQRRLLLAESGELVPDVRPVWPGQIFRELERSIGAKAAARLILVPVAPEARPLSTDPAILSRILGNMAVNALEAMPVGGLAKVWYEWRPGCSTFSVQNPGCIPPEVADRIFQRSFSTKAARGRGMGAYGMKLLGETVLGGKVGFTTDWEEGTRFFIELPSGD